MNDDQSKLIAKIQYFYDVMNSRLSIHENTCLSSDSAEARFSSSERCSELNDLSLEYSKTFENFLYKEPLDVAKNV